MAVTAQSSTRALRARTAPTAALASQAAAKECVPRLPPRRPLPRRPLDPRAVAPASTPASSRQTASVTTAAMAPSSPSATRVPTAMTAAFDRAVPLMLSFPHRQFLHRHRQARLALVPNAATHVCMPATAIAMTVVRARNMRAAPLARTAPTAARAYARRATMSTRRLRPHIRRLLGALLQTRGASLHPPRRTRLHLVPPAQAHA